MKIAVTFDNGNVFEHFGKAEQFKIYDVVDGKVESAEVVDCGVSGHNAVAELMAEKQVDVVISGGCGAGAQSALEAKGIEVVTGAQGDADAMVAAYLAGALESQGANCDHHSHDEEGGCGCGDDCGCSGGGCGGCGGGCGGNYQPPFDGPNVGKTVRVHYTGTLDDGTKFDSSYDRDEPLEFVCGAGMMILGFDAACADMEPGMKVEIHLTPEMAYGMPDPRAIMTFEITALPGAEALEVGQRVYLQNAMGQPFPVTVVSVEGGNITFDGNHELAGKELNFAIEMVEILD